MTKELARQYYKEFVADPDLFADPESYKPYGYDEEGAVTDMTETNRNSWGEL